VIVSILSPQQRGLQCKMKFLDQPKIWFQFSVPNKGDCNRLVGIDGQLQISFNSQSPTKGTAIC